MSKSPLYERIAVAKVRMILERIDAALDSNKTETVLLNDKLSVEHLLPQKWEMHWPLSTQDEVATMAQSQARDIIKHTIGNLTLLTDALNASLSMGPWEKKRLEILKQSKLNLNREFQDTLQWNEEFIRSRGDRLALLAKRIWPRPSTAPAPQ